MTATSASERPRSDAKKCDDAFDDFCTSGLAVRAPNEHFPPRRTCTAGNVALTSVYCLLAEVETALLKHDCRMER